MRAGLLVAHGLALVATTFCSASLALAKDFKTVLVAGEITYKITADDPVPLGNSGLVLITQKLEGTVKSSIPDSPVDKSKQICVGSITFKQNKAMAGGGYCETVDADGDIWWLHWWAGETRSRWEVSGGIGKYAGLEGVGYTFFPGDLQEVEAQGTWSQGYEGALIFK